MQDYDDPFLQDDKSIPQENHNICNAYLIQDSEISQQLFQDFNKNNSLQQIPKQTYRQQYFIEEIHVGQFLDLTPLHKEGSQKRSYAEQTRKDKVARFREKRQKRVWKKKVNYKCRQNVANGRRRIKGRFVSNKEENEVKEIQQVINTKEGQGNDGINKQENTFSPEIKPINTQSEQQA